MKITINADVTPQELRVFFGLPDVKPLQDEMLDKVREQIRAASADGLDPVSVMKAFMPQSVQSIETLQKAFWEAFLSGKKATVAEESESGNGGGGPAAGKEKSAKS